MAKIVVTLTESVDDVDLGDLPAKMVAYALRNEKDYSLSDIATTEWRVVKVEIDGEEV